MAAINTIAEINGNLTKIYAPRIERLHPDEFPLQKMIKFSKADRLGENYNQPVILQREQGVTYAAAGAGAFTIDAAVAGQIKTAVVDGSQCMVRAAIDFEMLAKSADKSGPKDGAYEDANTLVLENLTMTVKHRLECALWHGRTELGTVASVSGKTITLKVAEWAPGIWSGQNGAKIEIFSSDETLKRGYLSTVFTLDKVDIGNKILTFVEDVAPAAAATAQKVAANDRLFFKTEVTTNGTVLAHNNFLGVTGIQKATTSAELFGIDPAQYNLWQPLSGTNGLSALDAAGQLSFETYQDALAVGMGNGLKGKTTMYVNPATWAKLMTDQAALVRHVDKSGSKYTMGAESITFYSQVGMTTITSCIMVKEGYAHIIKDDLWKRIGATDTTFKVPGRGEELFKLMENQAGVEVRCYYHQALFTKAPARTILITGVVN